MAWLLDWANRIPLTIDSVKIDEDLVNFPVMITLESGTGTNAFDATPVFDEITPLIGTTFTENFSASGTNWTHLAGTTVYTSGYLDQTANNSSDQTTDLITFGTLFDLKFKFTRYNNSGTSPSNYSKLYICNDDTGVCACAIELFTYTSSAGSYHVKLYKQNGSVFTALFTDTQYNYTTEVGVNAWFWFNIRREYDKLYFKIWKTTDAEPSNWNYEYSYVFDDFTPTVGRIKVTCDIASSKLEDITLRRGSEYYPKKLAIASGDGTVQLPVEIEWWDAYSKRAWLWTKVPAVAASTDTTLYLYYDSEKDENINYVGFTDSNPAIQVWDSDYLFVGHMNSVPSNGYLKDSSSYNHDSTAFSVDLNDYLTTVMGPTYSIDNATQDRIELGYSNTLATYTGTLTLESVFYTISSHVTYERGIVSRGEGSSVATRSWALTTNGAGPYKLIWNLSENGTTYNQYSTSTIYNLNNWYYAGCRYIPSMEALVVINDVVAASGTSSVPSSLYLPASPSSTNNTCYIGNYYRSLTTDNYYTYDGMISEVRISKIARSTAWMKATYFTLFDNLISFSSIEHVDRYYYHGYVKEEGVNVVRKVRLYRRSTGQMVDEDFSNYDSITGYFYLSTAFDEEHYIVAFDDDIGASYNALIIDKIEPTGIE